jgi:ribosomal protein S18 acetylase RimI-like enzyme
VSQPSVVIVRRPGSTLPAEAGLADLLSAYHLSTEAEKGAPVARVQDLPDRYRREIDHPSESFADDVVLVAIGDQGAVGCLVLTAATAGTAEIKRLWTDPAFRGQGVAGRLITAALEEHRRHGPGVVRLSVWAWRTGALALYQRLGFVVVPSWDERDQLICLQRPV